MDIIVSGRVLKQTKKKQMSSTVVARLQKEMGQLENMRSLGKSSLFEYLKAQHGRKMRGMEHIYKYRLSDGDRILYTYGKYLPYIRDEQKEALVIIAYAKHDVQDTIGLPSVTEFHTGNTIFKGYSDVEITDQDLKDMSVNNLSEIEDFVSANFLNNHTFYVIDSTDFVDRDPSEIDVYLSDEQDQYIHEYMKSRAPLLIIGGAGTGKTVMATHILADYALKNKEAPCAYFTQSNELLRKVEKQYKYIAHRENAAMHSDSIDRAEFLNINDYCRSKLELKEQNLVKTEQFVDFIKQSPSLFQMINDAGISIVDLWAEIRGTIKGGLDSSWKRVTPADRTRYEPFLIERLEKSGILEWQQGNKLFIINRTDIPQSIIFSESEENAKRSAEYKQLMDDFRNVNIKLPLMPYEQYINISPELTTLSVEHRKTAYDICLQYQDWLAAEKKYDENDLAMRMLAHTELFNQYDMVVVDEIQDYTELQIYLLKQLTKNVKYFIMSGDAHQNINPTLFSERRIHSLFNEKLLVQVLQKNFRCQKRVIEFANALAELRNTYIAKDKGDRYEYSQRDGEAPILLEYSEENVINIISELAKYPGTAILTPTEEDKNILKKISSKHHGVDMPDNIFTVAEIKGMEYRYVVCYNLIGCYKEIWKQILEERVARKETRYRYYFNLLYVGITRSQEYLCMLEPSNGNSLAMALADYMGKNFRICSVFDADELFLSRLSNSEEDWFDQAKKYEEAGQYELAIQNYLKAEASREVIDRCRIKLYINQKNYEAAMKLAMQLNDKIIIQRLLPEIRDLNNDLYRLAFIWCDIGNFTSDNGYNSKVLLELIARVFSEDKQEDVRKYFITQIDEGFEKIMNNIMEAR